MTMRLSWTGMKNNTGSSRKKYGEDAVRKATAVFSGKPVTEYKSLVEKLQQSKKKKQKNKQKLQQSLV